MKRYQKTIEVKAVQYRPGVQIEGYMKECPAAPPKPGLGYAGLPEFPSYAIIYVQGKPTVVFEYAFIILDDEGRAIDVVDSMEGYTEVKPKR